MKSTREAPGVPFAEGQAELVGSETAAVLPGQERRGRKRALHFGTGHRGRRRELMTLGRAGISSLVATMNDGLVYQGLLSTVRSHYALAALGGAVMGAIMNFSLNRAWTFRGPWKSMPLQASQYALAALVTFLSLQIMLVVFIEGFGMGTRLAWIPAKTLTFAVVGYPMQRFLVFGTLRKKRSST